MKFTCNLCGGNLVTREVGYSDLDENNETNGGWDDNEPMVAYCRQCGRTQPDLRVDYDEDAGVFRATRK